MLLIYGCNAVLLPVVLPPDAIEEFPAFYLMSLAGVVPALVRTLTVVGVAVATLACRRALSSWTIATPPRTRGRVRPLAAGTAWVILTITAWPLVADLLFISMRLDGRARFLTACAGWLSLLASVTLLFLRGANKTASQMTLTLLPYVLWLAAHISLGTLDDPWIANADYRSDALRTMVGNLEVLLVAYLLWSALEWADVVATTATTVLRGSPRVVLGIAATKTAWVTAGLAGLLPAALGGDLAVWAAVKSDGWASWLTAGCVGALLLILLVRASRAAIPASDVGLKTGVVLLFGAVLASPGVVTGVWGGVRSLLTAALYFHRGVAALGVCLAAAVVCGVGLRRLEGTSVRGASLTLGALAATVSSVLVIEGGLKEYVYVTELAWLGGYYFLVPPVVLVIAGVIVWLRLKQTSRLDGRILTGMIFATLALAPTLFHAAPRIPQLPIEVDVATLGATGDFYTIENAESFMDDRPAAVEGPFEGAGGSFEVATLDIVLTAGSVVALLIGRRRLSRRFQAVVGLMLTSFWVFSYASWLSLPRWQGEIWFFVAFVIPVAWQLLVRARPFNTASSEHRPAIVLGIIGLLGLVVAVAGYQAMTGALDPTRPYGDSLFQYAGSFGVRYWLVAFGLIAVVDRVLEMDSGSRR